MFCFLESYVNIILTFPFRCVSPVKQEIKVNVTGYQSLNISNGVMSLPPHLIPPPNENIVQNKQQYKGR